jgi:serine/threonine-protein kinase
LSRAGHAVARARRAPGIPIGAFVVVLAVGTLGVLLTRGGPQQQDAVPDAAAPVVSSEAPPRAVDIEVDGADAATWRARLKDAPEHKDWRRGAAAVLALAKLDRAAFHDNDCRLAAMASIAGVAFEEGDLADRVFDVLKNDLGDDGLDLLFDLVRARGGTKAGKRAQAVLESPEMSARVPKGMKLALELRRKTCDEKRAMFARAAEEGDSRVLVELRVLREAECPRRRDPCCFRDDAELAQAIKALKAKLGD